MKKLSNSLPLLLILMLSITTMASLSPVYASPTDLSVLFPNGTTESINEYFTGDMFAVDIYVADVTDLFGFEFKLKYDPSVLTAVDVIIGDFLQPDYTEWYKEVNDTLGYVWYAVTQVGGEAGVDGYGTLALIVFSVDNDGATLLDLSESILVNSNAGFVDFVASSGIYSNIGYPPVASFTFSPEDPIMKTTVTLDASLSYDPDGTIVSYAWDFGDGTTQTTATPITEYAFEMIGTYTLTLVVTDNLGANGKTTATIRVLAPITAMADLCDWKAKPQHRNHDISTRGNVNEFYAMVQNWGNISETLTVKVIFEVCDADMNPVRTVETNEYVFPPYSYEWTTDYWMGRPGYRYSAYGLYGLNTTTAGEFDVTGLAGRFFATARCYYMVGTSGTWVPGTKTKTFGFTVKP